MPRKKQSADQRRKLAREWKRIKRRQETAEEAEERKAKGRERSKIVRAEEFLVELESWRAADWLEHFPTWKMFVQNSQSTIYQEIMNALRKAIGQEVDVLPDSGCEEDDNAVPTTRRLDHQKDSDVTLDTSSVVHTGESEASKEVDKDHLEDKNLLQRLEVPHDRSEHDLPSKRRQEKFPEKFRIALARVTGTAEERKERLQRIAKAVARALATETEEELAKRLRRSAKAKTGAQATETEEKRRERLRRNAEAQARLRANETKEKREQRLRRAAERGAARRRALKEQALLQQHSSEGAETNTTESESQSTGKVSHKCTFCKASFDKAESLVTHIWVHMEKPYKCPLCLASFFKISTLNAHIVTSHAGEKPHKCLICLASFSTSDSLKAHSLTTHTGENPHRITQINVKEEPSVTKEPSVKEEPSVSMDGSSFELGSDQIKEEVMDIEVVEHGLDQVSY